MTDLTDQEIHSEVRDWLDANWDPDASLIEWRTRLVDSGWAMPAWPERWYGKGLSAAQANLVAEVFAETGAVGVACRA